MDNTPNKMHPLMMVAAISVTLASLAAIGVMTGMLPGRHADAPVPAASLAAAPATAVASAEPVPAPVAVPGETPASFDKPADKPTEKPARTTNVRKTAAHDGGRGQPAPPPSAAASEPPAPAAIPAAPPVCHECGTIDSVREIAQKGEGSGIGAVAGGVLGGVLGHQVGSGRGKDLATVIGAVGGAVAGHEVEKRQRKTVHYEITVRMDDGAFRTIDSASQPSWRGGERVRIVDGAIVPMMQ